MKLLVFSSLHLYTYLLTVCLYHIVATYNEYQVTKRHLNTFSC